MFNESWVETWEDVYGYCRGSREDSYCRHSLACSGPCYSNIAGDYDDVPEGVSVLRGGNYGDCIFYVRDKS